MSRDFRAGVDYPSVVCFTPREELCVFVSTIITIRIRKVTNGGQDFSGPEFRVGVDYSYRTFFMSGMFDIFITIKIRKVTLRVPLACSITCSIIYSISCSIMV
jgi:hypothetical protein